MVSGALQSGGLPGCPLGMLTGDSWKRGHGGSSTGALGLLRSTGRAEEDRRFLLKMSRGDNVDTRGAFPDTVSTPKMLQSTLPSATGHPRFLAKTTHLGLNPDGCTFQLCALGESPHLSKSGAPGT